MQNGKLSSFSGIWLIFNLNFAFVWSVCGENKYKKTSYCPENGHNF